MQRSYARGIDLTRNRPRARGQGRGQVRRSKFSADIAVSYGRNHRTECPLWSITDIEADWRNVRFTTKSGHWNSVTECPLCAKSGHMRCSNRRRIQRRTLAT